MPGLPDFGLVEFLIGAVDEKLVTGIEVEVVVMAEIVSQLTFVISSSEEAVLCNTGVLNKRSYISSKQNFTGEAKNF